MPLRELIPILQVAIGPVILISGIGLLLLSMTSRFGRVIDRAREMLVELHSAPDLERKVISSQIEILSARVVIARQAVRQAIISVLFAALLVITLFLSPILRWEVGVLVVVLFMRT